MNEAQLQTIADLVAIAHDKYDGYPSHRDDIERFDRLLAEAETQSATEQLAAILAEMRDDRIIRLDGADVTRCMLHNLADRIEAAVGRALAALARSRAGKEGSHA